jgi:hypothetical protein
MTFPLRVAFAAPEPLKAPLREPLGST